MAPAEDDISIEEKRVYAGSAGRTDAYVATGTGVVRAAISGDTVGEFELALRDPARDVAVLVRDGGADLLAVAAAEGLRVVALDDDPDGFGARDGHGVPGDVALTGDSGAPVAVGVDGRAFLVADAAGGIHRVAPDAPDAAADLDAADAPDDPDTPDVTATRIGDVDDPRAIDGPLVAAADGVHRVVGSGGDGTGPGTAGADEPTVEAVGLDDARDVAGAGVPLAATADGLHRLGNGWMAALDGDATAVAADGDGHAMAVVDGGLRIRAAGADESEGDGRSGDAWRAADLPVDEDAVALGYGPGMSVVVTATGTLCVDAGDGWRHRMVGVRDVAGVALAVVE